MPEKKVIVYIVLNDYKQIRDIEKSLWANKQNIPFDGSFIKIAPDPRPGYKPSIYLNITEPSEKLIKEIKTSYISDVKYPQFESFTDKDMLELIKMMVYTQKRDPKEIAKTLGVTVADIMMWSYYSYYSI